jgi:hypothetical protein
MKKDSEKWLKGKTGRCSLNFAREKLAEKNEPVIDIRNCTQHRLFIIAGRNTQSQHGYCDGIVEESKNLVPLPGARRNEEGNGFIDTPLVCR